MSAPRRRRSISGRRRVASTRSSGRGTRPSAKVLEAEAAQRRLLAVRDRIQHLLPDIDPGDLLLILECLLESPERRWERPLFVHEIRPGVYAF